MRIEQEPKQSERANAPAHYRLAWLTLPLMLAIILALWAADLRASYESRFLLVITNFLFTWLVSVCVAFVAGRSFLANGETGLLLFGCGTLLWGFTTLVAASVVHLGGNATITIHNLGILGSALCHSAGLMQRGSPRAHPGARRLPAWVRLLAGYAGALAGLALIVWATLTGRAPVFFVQGEGGTPVRQLVLGTAILLLAATAGVLLIRQKRTASLFLYHYALGLALLALGLAGVWLQSVHGSALGWAGRITQCLGGIYLFFAAWAHGGWIVSLGPAQLDDRLLRWLTPRRFASLTVLRRYALASAIAGAGTALRWAMTPVLGNSEPYLFAMAATVAAAVLLEFRAGVFCSLLGVLTAHGLVLGSSPEAWETAALLRMSLALATGVFMVTLLHAARAGAVRARASEERYRKLFRSMTEGFALHQIIPDEQGLPFDAVIQDANAAFERLTGLKRSSLLGKSIREIMPAAAPQLMESYREVAFTGHRMHLESPTIVAGRWLAALAYRAGPGQVAVIFSDVTARRQARAALQRERDLLQAVMNGARNSHLVYLDRDFHFVRVNETYAATCGFRPEEMVGKNHFALYPHAENESIFRQVRDTGEAVVFHDKPFEFPDQPERGVTYWDWSLTPVKDATGQVVGLIFSLFDTTARKRTENQLAASLKELREAQQELVRRERLATLGKLAGSVAHEMRTPLTVIQNATFYLDQNLPPDAPAVREVLAEIGRAIGSADHIITEMLDFVREPTPCDTVFGLGEAIARALELAPLPDTVHCRTSAAGSAAIAIRANEDQVTRILVNLIQNAAQAMPQGGELEFGAVREDEGIVCIQIRDTGHGVPQENLERIFEPLFTTKARGIGLGLAIARRYARLNGGDLTAQSEAGFGTTFLLRLRSG